MWREGLVVVTRGLSCSAACEIFVSQPGIKPPSPALQGSFLTTGPLGRSWCAYSPFEIFLGLKDANPAWKAWGSLSSPGWRAHAAGPLFLLCSARPRPPTTSAPSPADWIQLISLLTPPVRDPPPPFSLLEATWRTPNDR